MALGLGCVLAPGAAGAQSDPCPVSNPLCHSTIPTEPTTSTTRFELTTTTSTFDGTVPRESTSTTVRRRATSTQEPTSTTARSVTVSTVNDLLIPGDGTKGAESTTTTVASLAKAKGGLSDDQLIVLVVIGLALVALVFGILTWRYWSATRPRLEEPARPVRSGRG